MVKFHPYVNINRFDIQTQSNILRKYNMGPDDSDKYNMCEAGPLHPKMHFSGILLFKEIYHTIAQDKLPEGLSSVLIKKPMIKV